MEPRLVLIAVGFVLATAALEPMAAFDGLTKGMTQKDMICCICSVMGFVQVMRYTGCDKHLCHALAKPLRLVQSILLPCVTLFTFFVNFALPSASGTAAALGAVAVPLLLNLGVHPAMAGAAILLGTYGSILSPCLFHNVFVAQIASEALGCEVTAMDVIARHYVASISSVLVGAASLWALSFILKENRGHEGRAREGECEFLRANPALACIPVLPVCALLAGAAFPEQLPALASLRVEHVMLLASALALAASRKDPTKGAREFFKGLGFGYADVMGILIAAAVFVAGIKAVGLVDAGIELLAASKEAAGPAGAAATYLMAIVCGAGDTATLAFNEAVTIHASAFGMDAIDMGSLATLAGAIGRCACPIASVTFVCAGLCSASPIEIVKRTFLPSTLALCAGTFVLLAL